jgi:hypothetical protein
MCERKETERKGAEKERKREKERKLETERKLGREKSEKFRKREG